MTAKNKDKKKKLNNSSVSPNDQADNQIEELRNSIETPQVENKTPVEGKNNQTDNQLEELRKSIETPQGENKTPVGAVLGEEMNQTPNANKPICESVDDEHFKLNGKPQYWKNLVAIPNKALPISGAVLVGDMRKFFALAPKSLNYANWMRDFDPVQERIEKAKAKMKRKIGLKED